MGGHISFRVRGTQLGAVALVGLLATFGLQWITQSIAEAAPATAVYTTSPNTLTITGDNVTADSIVVSCSGGNVVVTSITITPSTPTCASLTRIVISTGGLSDSVDLRGVVGATFTGLTGASAVSVNLGPGGDVFYSSAFVDTVVKQLSSGDTSNVGCSAAGTNVGSSASDSVTINADSAAAPSVDTTGSSTAPIVTVTQGSASVVVNSCINALSILNTGNPMLRGGQLIPVTPYRIADSRGGSGYQLAGYKLDPSSSLPVTLAGTGSAPNNVPAASQVSAVILNVTATDVEAGGWLKVYPSDTAEPNISNLNVIAGETRANNVTVRMSADGQVYLKSLNRMNVVVDVLGYYTSDAVPVTPTGHFESVEPTRVFDSRPGDENISEWSYGLTGPIAGGATFDIDIADNTTNSDSSFLGDGISAVVLNVTVISLGAPGYVTVWPRGATRPASSNVNVGAGDINPNLVVVPVRDFGDITFFTQNPSHVLADLVGYFTSEGLYSSGRFQAATPERFFDSRDATWGNAQITNNYQWGVQIAGRSTIASSASAVVANVTAVPAVGGYVSVFPADSDIGSAILSSSLNMVSGKPVANAVWSELSTGPSGSPLLGYPNSGGQIGLYVNSAAWVIVDVAGWFTAA